MKQLLIKLLALLFSFLQCIVGGGSTDTASDNSVAMLKFDTFEGGGFEYVVEIADPTILSFTSERVYFDDNHEALEGAAYSQVFAFSGLKQGETDVIIHASSPIAGNYDAKYHASVDADLSVSIQTLKNITSFSIYRYGEIAYDSYEIIEENGEYLISVSGDEYISINSDTVEALCRIVAEHDLYDWDGFNGSNNYVLDGEGFHLEIRFTDGTSITAAGNNSFPENYFAVMNDIRHVLEQYSDYYDDIAGADEIHLPRDAISIKESITAELITDFYYTYDSSAYPPEFYRFRFYTEESLYYFYYEMREGDHWPLTEDDITVSGKTELSENEWSVFFDHIRSGWVTRRSDPSESDDGDSGPWIFLYWIGDKEDYQEYSFASTDKRNAFEEYCAQLMSAAI